MDISLYVNGLLILMNNTYLSVYIGYFNNITLFMYRLKYTYIIKSKDFAKYNNTILF